MGLIPTCWIGSASNYIQIINPWPKMNFFGLEIHWFSYTKLSPLNLPYTLKLILIIKILDPNRYILNKYKVIYRT